MYRNKSTISLRTLAYSLKNSITLDRQKAHSRQFIPLRNSSSTLNLANYKNQTKTDKFNQQYLILLNTRKSKLSDANTVPNRQNDFSDLRYDLKTTKQLIRHKERLLHMTGLEPKQKIADEKAVGSARAPVQSTRITSSILLLEEEQKKIKQNIEKNLCLKNYNKYIDESEKLSKQIKDISKKQNQFVEYRTQLQCRLGFLQEEIISIEMNFAEDLAEKQYCEEFLDQYQNGHQNLFREEAQNVIKMIELQRENEQIATRRAQLEKDLESLEKQFKQWKVEQKLQLKQKRFDNQLKENRIQLMKIEQDLDGLTQEIIEKLTQENLSDHGIRKVRQYVCAYFKKYNQLNINHISHAEIEDGIDIFLCKEGLIKEFTKFVFEKTDKIRLIHPMYSLKLTQYTDCLKKIQTIFSGQKTEINRVLTLKYEEKIISIKQNLQKLSSQAEKNLSQIETLYQNIQKILAQQSLSMIELLNKGQFAQYGFNKDNGFLNLQEIKSKVKEMKIEQVKRISRVKEVYERLKRLEQKETSYTETNKQKMSKLMQEKQSLKKEIQTWNKKVFEIQQIKKGYESKKSKCDSFIDQAISKMKQRDENEKNLAAIQKEIEKLKKQKIQAITQKHQQRRLLDDFINLQQSKFKRQQPSGVKLLQRTKSYQSRNFLSERTQNKLKLEHFRISKKENQCSKENYSSQYKLNNQIIANSNQNEDKLSNKTQSSFKNQNQRLSLNALDSILLSKCNLVQSKNVISKPKEVKKSLSILRVGSKNQQNEASQEQLLLESNPQSLKNSKRSNKQNPSRKTSLSKKTQRNTIKYGQNRYSPAKLSLRTNRKQSLNQKKERGENTFSKSKLKDCNHHTIKRDLNSIICNKLLRR